MKWARDNGTLIHIHSSEEPATTSGSPERTDDRGGVAQRIGFLDRDTLLAHQVNCTENDLRILRETAPWSSTTPSRTRSSGPASAAHPHDGDGIPVAVSTDGSGSADKPEHHQRRSVASQYQKRSTPTATLLPRVQALELITVEPARCSDERRNDRAGRDADLVLMDLRGANLTADGLDTVVENLLWAANGSEARYVVAAGELLLDDYRPTRVDATRILSDVQRLSELFMEYASTAPEVRGTGAHR
jgi:5-methylthioadenosine/S-adenosylhomocysteine deaminase